MKRPKPDAGKKRRVAMAKIAREAELARLFLRHGPNWTQKDYADAIGCSQPSISRYLTQLVKEWRARTVKDMDAAKRQELARLDEIELAAWASFEGSREPQVSVVATTYAEGCGAERADNGQTRTRTDHTSGDPRWLNVVLECVRQRRVILGLDAPQKQKMSLEARDEPVEIRVVYGEGPR